MGRLVRKEDWVVQLFAEIESCNDKVFEWGKFDCCTFAAGCVEKMTGQNVFPDIDYSTREEAQTILEDNAGLRKMATDALGELALPPLAAGRGDIAMRYDDATGMLSLGVCVGDQVAFPAVKGIAYISLDSCICCWKVG